MSKETVKTIEKVVPSIFTLSATLLGFAEFMFKLREAGYEFRPIRNKKKKYKRRIK